MELGIVQLDKSNAGVGTFEKSNQRRLGMGKRNLIVLALGAFSLTACNLPAFGAFRGATTQGQNEFHLWQGFILTAIVVGIVTWGALFYAVFKFRRCGDQIPKQTHSNLKWELIYTIIPVLIVIGLFAATYVTENEITNVSSHPALRVTVVAYQWGWKFEYPGGVNIVPKGANYPTLELPEGKTTTIKLVSNDVVHGFYIPEFNFSRYALPGVTNYFDFKPTRAGYFEGRCSQLCGLYHAEMLFHVRVVSSSDFNNWLTTQQQKVTA
ncbi:MAG: cytochrome c oxidase subunit II [Actinomycetota bacterium]|nr:MAG: cytochrome c oxidase subunit II [Actinomycetota bacterium]